MEFLIRFSGSPLGRFCERVSHICKPTASALRWQINQVTDTIGSPSSLGNLEDLPIGYGLMVASGDSIRLNPSNLPGL